MTTTAASAVNAQALAEQISEYLAAHPHAMLVEDGQAAFYFSPEGGAHYSLCPEQDRCVLQVWSEERNIVRRVIGAQMKNSTLRLSVSRFGQAKPSTIELCERPEGQSPSAKKAARAVYAGVLQRLLQKEFPGWTVDRITTAADLEHSFGPAYARGLVHLGRRYIAVVGAAHTEPQPTIEGIATVAVLWLERCRERLADKGHVEGVAVFAPKGRARALLLRLAHLNQQAAKWRLFEVDAHGESATEIDVAPPENLATRLIHCPDEVRTLERFSASVKQMRELAPRSEAIVVSTAEVSFRMQGLEFARAMVAAQDGFRTGEKIVFGAAPAEYELNPDTEPLLRQLVARLEETRTRRNRLHPFYRMASERWLESIVRRELSLLDERLDPTCVYEQVPAFAASDRAMIDLLGVTRDGRLAVIELKADEDLHLPIQGLDYWARVRWHHSRGEFLKFGYFGGREMSSEAPLLF
ncbi:MAG TPA: hypothetical protein VF786_09905, partial [Terriglobales bacterium]